MIVIILHRRIESHIGAGRVARTVGHTIVTGIVAIAGKGTFATDTMSHIDPQCRITIVIAAAAHLRRARAVHRNHASGSIWIVPREGLATIADRAYLCF